jgi:hypothetical protein
MIPIMLAALIVGSAVYRAIRANLSGRRMLHVSSQCECDLQEAIMTKGYVLSKVAMKTVYVSFTAAALLFVFTVLLTGIHP